VQDGEEVPQNGSVVDVYDTEKQIADSPEARQQHSVVIAAPGRKNVPSGWRKLTGSINWYVVLQ
jgi:hypothetical protein